MFFLFFIICCKSMISAFEYDRPASKTEPFLSLSQSDPARRSLKRCTFNELYLQAKANAFLKASIYYISDTYCHKYTHAHRWITAYKFTYSSISLRYIVEFHRLQQPSRWYLSFITQLWSVRSWRIFGEGVPQASRHSPSIKNSCREYKSKKLFARIEDVCPQDLLMISSPEY